MILSRLAELKGKSFVEKGMQLEDIPSSSLFSSTSKQPRVPASIQRVTKLSDNVSFMHFRFIFQNPLENTM
jgi:hypothetical protein